MSVSSFREHLTKRLNDEYAARCEGLVNSAGRNQLEDCVKRGEIQMIKGFLGWIDDAVLDMQGPKAEEDAGDE